MKAMDFVHVCDSLRPLLWAVAAVIVLLALGYVFGLWGESKPPAGSQPA
jgi:hypothetical protein